MRADLQAAKKLLGDSRYGGETAVILSATDFPLVGPMGQVTADLLQKVGFKTDLRESDLGTLVQRRVSRKPTGEGGWSVFHSFGDAIAYADPGTSPLIGEDGPAGWFGWPSNPAVGASVQAWVDATDPAGRQQAAYQAGALALEDVATLPLGQFFVKTAFRTSITGVASGPAPYPFNVRPA
jgi:peptide/nickel transport system substrate-binding protein